MRSTDGGSGDDSEMGLVTKKGKQTWTTGIGASLTLDYRGKEESNIIIRINCFVCLYFLLLSYILFVLTGGSVCG